jgi:hypothetical protein
MLRCAAVVSHSLAFPLCVRTTVELTAQPCAPVPTLRPRERFHRNGDVVCRHPATTAPECPVTSSTSLGTPTYHEIAQHPPMLTTRTGVRLPARSTVGRYVLAHFMSTLWGDDTFASLCSPHLVRGRSHEVDHAKAVKSKMCTRWTSRAHGLDVSADRT